MLFQRAFFNILFRLVVQSLSLRKSMLGTATAILLNEQCQRLRIRRSCSLRTLLVSAKILLSTTTIDNAEFPVGIEIGALFFGAVFAKLEDLGVAHADDQILRFFAKLVDILRLANFLKERFIELTVPEIFDKHLDIVLAICILLFDYRKKYAKNSVVNGVVPSFPVALR